MRKFFAKTIIGVKKNFFLNAKTLRRKGAEILKN